jgi:alkylation response protein AidB-like acyl-CoA dehydrogenase
VTEKTLDQDPEVRAMRAMARDLATAVIGPRAVEIDESETFPVDVPEQFRRQGFLGLAVPEAYDGAGGRLRHVAAVAEELARVDVSSACTFNSHASCAILIGAVGDEEQQARLFGRIVNEGALVSLALTEPEAGSDAASLRTAAVADGDRYVLNGVKHYCTNADFAEFLLVFAATPRADGSRPISVFVVGKDNPGLHIRRREKKMGLHGTTTVEFELRDCLVPATDRLGAEGAGFRVGLRALQRGRVAVAAIAVGAADAALEHAITYARDRRQFGVAIGSFQGLQFKLADMGIQLAAARQLVAHAIAAGDSDAADFAVVSAQAKCFATDTAMAVATEAVQVFGGAGYMRGTYVERVMRDVKVLQIFEGTNELMRVLVARGLLGPPDAPR